MSLVNVARGEYLLLARLLLNRDIDVDYTPLGVTKQEIQDKGLFNDFPGRMTSFYNIKED